MKSLRPIFYVCLSLIAVLVLLLRVPAIVEFSLVKLFQNMPPSKIIRIGEPVLCEQLKEDIVKSPEEKQRAIHSELIALVQENPLDFAAEVSREDAWRNLLSLISDAPQGGGLGLATRCLVESLFLIKSQKEKTLSALLDSEALFSRSELLLKLIMDDSIQRECKEQKSCSEILKQKILRTTDAHKVRQMITWLGSTGEVGGLALFEIYDQTKDPQTSALILGQIRFHNTSPKYSQFLKTQLNLRQQQAAYPNDKKLELANWEQELKAPVILGSDPPGSNRTVAPTPTPAPRPYAELIAEGRAVAQKYKTEVPETNRPFQSWASEIRSYPVTVTNNQNDEVLKIIAEIRQSILTNLGPKARFLEELSRFEEYLRNRVQGPDSHFIAEPPPR